MEQPRHDLADLFKQLGLHDSDEAIDQFVAKHSGIGRSLNLHEADFWNPAQAAFLQQVKDEDADWIEIVDHLDAMLR